MTWSDWAQLQGLQPLPEGHAASLTLGNYPLLIEAALAGHGVALGWRPLVDALLRSGQLVQLAAPTLHTARGYSLVRPHGREAGDALDGFSAWITGGCAPDVA
jgi:DNA-binding transcriptional LysR family regulator